MCIYSYDAFLLLKIVKIRFLFGVNVCVYIPMMLFYYWKLLKSGLDLVLMYVYIFLWCLLLEIIKSS